MQGFGFIHFPSAAAAANFYTNPPSVSISGREYPSIIFITRPRLTPPFRQAPSCSDLPRTTLQLKKQPAAPKVLQSTRLLQAVGAAQSHTLQLPQLHKLAKQRAPEAAGKNQRRAVIPKGENLAGRTVEVERTALSPRQGSKFHFIATNR